MMLLTFAAAMAFTPAVPQNIDVGQADWASFPRLETENIAVPSGEMVGRVQRLMQRGECSFEGQRAQRFSIDINYAVRLDSAGNATQIVVQDIGCRPLELMVGRIAADIVQRGFVRTPPPAQPTTYSRRINFNLS
jgi:hypothetical protein